MRGRRKTPIFGLPMWGAENGSYTIEALLVLPVILIVLFATLWGGSLMYTWTSVNYGALSGALDAAKNGEFSTGVRQAVASYLQNFTPGGKQLQVDYLATSAYENPGKIVVWGPAPGQKFNRGQTITVGVVCPVKVSSPLLSLLGQTVFGGDTIYLKARATARSEVFLESTTPD